MPVIGKDFLELIDDRSVKQDRRVAPIPPVLVPDVQSTDDCLAAVGNDDFAVISKVQLKRTAKYLRRHERSNARPGLDQRLHEFSPHGRAADSVVEDANLNALPGTRLYKRLETEDRLVGASTGNNIDGTLNFVPRMDRDTLIQGYRRLIRSAYSPANIYQRIRTFLKEYRPARHRRVCWGELPALFRSMWYLGVLGRSRFRYWRLFFGTLRRHPRAFAAAINLAVLGYHFEMMMRDLIARGGM